MKSKVLSVRLGIDTVAYCYQLQQNAGRKVTGKPIGTIIGDTVEAIIEAARRTYDIPFIETAEQAEEILSQFIDVIPTFDKPLEVDFETVRCARAGKEKTQQADATKENTPEEQKPTAYEETKPTATATPVVVSPSVMASIEALAAAEEDKETQALFEKVLTVEKSPDVPVLGATIDPWLGKVELAEKVIADDPFYAEACKVENEVLKRAIRIVYVNLKPEQWSSALAERLISKVYKDYVKWREENATN